MHTIELPGFVAGKYLLMGYSAPYGLLLIAPSYAEDLDKITEELENFVKVLFSAQA
ncbi:MAG: hypothetical protein QXS17_00900 [Candidatus Micrarchaeaceae archaeon]